MIEIAIKNYFKQDSLLFVKKFKSLYFVDVYMHTLLSPVQGTTSE